MKKNDIHSSKKLKTCLQNFSNVFAISNNFFKSVVKKFYISLRLYSF